MASMSSMSPLISQRVVGGLAGLLLVATAAIAAAAPPTAASSEAKLLAIIQGEASEADKALACKFVAINGTAAAVPALAPLLANPRLASWARIPLEAIPGPEASAALREAAGSLDGRLLAGVLTSLGVRGDTAALPMLAEKIAASDPEVAAAAAWALGRLATPEAAAVLVGGLDKAGSPERRDTLATAAVLCAAGLQAAGRADDAAAACEAVLAADVSPQRRAEATRGAIIAKGAGGIPLLVETLRSPTKRLANMAVFTARDLGRSAGGDAALAAAVDEALLAEVEAATTAGIVPRAVVLIDVLAERGSGGASEPLVVGLTRSAAPASPKPIRLAAIEALGRAGDAGVVGPLLAAAADEDPGIANTARAAVAAVSGAAVDREIVSRLAEADAKVLPALIELVGRRRIDALPALLPLAAHPDEQVRRATLVALGPTVDLANLGVLVTASTAATSDAERELARTALREASVRMADREGCAATLVAALEKTSAEAKVMLLNVIGEVGGTKAVAAMAAAARSGEAALEDAATRLLGTWMTADAAPVLLELATAEPAGRFKTRALRGYIRIARQFVLPDDERAAMCRLALAAAGEDADRKAVLEILVRYPSGGTLAVAEEAAKLPGLEAEAQKAAAEIRAKLEPAKKAG
jgi:hypothetical protein